MKSGCEGVRERLLEYATDGQDAPDSALVAGHLPGCPGCRASLDRIRSDLALLRADTSHGAKLSPGFRSRFWAEVDRKRSVQPWWALPSLLRYAAPVTTAALVVAIGWLVLHRGPEEPVVPPSQKSNVVAVHPPVSRVLPPGEGLPAVTPPSASHAPVTPPTMTPPPPTSTQKVPEQELLDNLEFVRYLQYMEMMDGREVAARADRLVLPGENET